MENNRKQPGNSPVASASNLPEWTVLLVLLCVVGFLFRDFIGSNDMLYGSDTLSLGYMAREFYANLIRNGVFPLWNPFILGGTPFLESLAGGDSLYPPSTLLLLFLETHRALGWKLILHIILAGLFMYKWIRSLHLGRKSAFISAVAYSLSPIMVSLVHGGQDGKIFVIALTPLLFWASESFVNRPSSRSFSLVSLVIGLIILTTHFQMAYFLFISVGFYTVFNIFVKKSPEKTFAKEHQPIGRIRLAISFGFAAILGLTLSAVQFFPAASYVTEHSRRTATTLEATAAEARSYSSSWSLHPEEIVGLAIPEFVGVSNANEPWAQNTYWGRNGFKGNHEYLGILVLLLAGIGLLGTRKKYLRNSMAVMAILSLFFSLGEHTPLWGLFYTVVPGINLFRAPSLAIFLVGFSSITLMALGLEEVWDLGTSRQKDSRWKKIWILHFTLTCLLLTGFLLSKSGALANLWINSFYQDISENSRQILESNQQFITKGFLNSLIVLTAAGVISVGLKRHLYSTRIATVLVAITLIIDVGRVDKSFIRTIDFESFRSADKQIQNLVERQKRETPFRVFSLNGLNGQDVRPGMFGLELVAGHHPNDLARYRDLIGMEGSSLPINLLTNHNILSMLNVRYILWPNQLGKPSDQDLPQKIVDDLTMMPQVDTGNPYSQSIYAFPTLERARLVDDAVIIPDREAALAFMLSDQFDPATQVVLHEPSPIPLQIASTEGLVSWISRDINKMKLKVITSNNTFLVLSDNWFPGWKARVNGVRADILRVNHSLRGIPLTSGEHSIEIYYNSSILNWSIGLTGSTLVILIMLTIGSPLKFKKQKAGTLTRKEG